VERRHRLGQLRARAYDPLVGRFLQADTFGGLTALPGSGNRYAYALLNPLRYSDPSGHFVSQIAVDPVVGYFDISRSALPSEPLSVWGPSLVPPDTNVVGFGVQYQVNPELGNTIFVNTRDIIRLVRF
jgi:RHS repeat-associated protein